MDEAWARVELMGHRVRVGRISEAIIAGAPMLRVDVPIGEAALDNWRAGELYSPSAIYCVTFCTEEIARSFNAPAVHSPELLERFDDDEDEPDDDEYGTGFR